MPANILINTVGTSLIYPNLHNLSLTDEEPKRAALAAAYADRDGKTIADCLAAFAPEERICGAEINSITSLYHNQHTVAEPRLIFCLSDTEDGTLIGEVLKHYYKARGFTDVQTITIEGLSDTDPKLFRRQGLRNLTKAICGAIRDHGVESCAINATGGYKAEIAIAVLMGQSLGAPAYYKHERFSEIIAFPPMPIALDFSYWLELSGILSLLAATDACVPAEQLAADWDERLESLIERTEIDGIEYLELSSAGNIFHETFRYRFRNNKDSMLPPAAAPEDKKEPKLEKSGHIKSHPDLLRYLHDVTRVPQVIQCNSWYYNPDLPSPTLFRLSPRGIEGTYSNGTYCVKFAVTTTATNDTQQAAVVAALNEWLHENQ